MNTIFKYETASNAETAQFKEKDINMTEKYFKIRAIVMTVFIIVTFALFAVSCDKNSSETENSNTTTTTTTQVTTTTSDEDDVTTTARPKETTTTKATTTAVTTTTSDEEDVTTTTTMATTTTNAQTTATTTKATTTTPQQTTVTKATITTPQQTTTKASETPGNTTAPIQIPSTAVTIPIDTTQKVANANDVAIVLLKSVGVDTTGVNISNTTDPEQFTEELQNYLSSVSPSRSVCLGYTDFPTSPLSRVTDEGKVFAFFGSSGPVVIWGADIQTKIIYGLNSNGVVVYSLEEYISDFGSENYEVYLS